MSKQSPAPPAETPKGEAEVNQETSTTQTATVTIERSYRRNWLRDTDEPCLYSNDVEGLRAAVDTFCGEDNARTLQRLVDAADIAACEQSGCAHVFSVACWQHGTPNTLIGFMCPKCGLRRAPELVEAASPIPPAETPKRQALRDMIARADAALGVVNDLCQGRRRWTMSVPAQPLYDPDILLTDSLWEMRQVLRQLLAEAASPAPRPNLKHPNRTIIVATRLSEKTLRTTYLNALDDEVPYVVTIDLNEPPHTPVSGIVPDVGETKVVVER